MNYYFLKIHVQIQKEIEKTYFMNSSNTSLMVLCIALVNYLWLGNVYNYQNHQYTILINQMWFCQLALEFLTLLFLLSSVNEVIPWLFCLEVIQNGIKIASLGDTTLHLYFLCTVSFPPQFFDKWDAIFALQKEIKRGQICFL